MSFDESLAFALRWEGGYVNHPHDRGGATNKGVTQRTYDEWRTRKGYDTRSVRGLDDGEARQIYHEQYWKPTRCAALDAPMDLILFDSAIQHGAGRAIRWLQELVGVPVDGHFGPRTMAACDDYEANHGTIALAAAFLSRREQFYADIIDNNPSQKAFERGWANRMKALRQECHL